MKRKILHFVIIIFFVVPVFSEIKSTIKGIVVDEKTNEGISGVEIYFIRYNSHAFNYRVITDTKGNFVIHSIIPSNYFIAFYPPPPYAWKRIEIPLVNTNYESIVVKKGKNVFIKKKMKIGGKIKIKVIDSFTNLPIKGVSFDSPNIRTRLTKIEETDDKGELIYHQLGKGTYHLYGELLGYGSKSIEFSINYEEDKEIVIEFNSNSKTNVSGYIKCKDSGIPLKEIVVFLDKKDSDVSGKDYTDENGFFSIKDLEPGNYTITIIAVEAGEWIEEDEEFSDLFIRKSVIVRQGIESKVNFNVDCSLQYRSKSNEL